MRAELVALHCLAMAGCASSIVHPTAHSSEWPRRSAPADCQMVGVYQDFKELRSITVTAPEQRHVHLSRLLRDGNLGSF